MLSLCFGPICHLLSSLPSWCDSIMLAWANLFNMWSVHYNLLARQEHQYWMTLQNLGLYSVAFCVMSSAKSFQSLSLSNIFTWQLVKVRGKLWSWHMNMSGYGFQQKKILGWGWKVVHKTCCTQVVLISTVKAYYPPFSLLVFLSFFWIKVKWQHATLLHVGQWMEIEVWILQVFDFESFKVSSNPL